MKLCSRCLFVLFFVVCAADVHGQFVKSLPAEPQTDWHQSSFWETLDGQPPEVSWEFADSEVRLVKPRGSRGSLVSGPLPSDFELSWQWKVEDKTNTGLKYRVRQFGPKWLGVEYQIIDEPVHASATGKGATASIYDLVAPRDDKPLRPAGEWNDARIVVQGHSLKHFLNGELVASTRTRGPDWDHRIALSKFYGAGGFGQPRPDDRIMLTDHGGKAVFRNFQFVAKPADEAPPATDGVVAPPYLANALRNSWADQNSIVLWTRTTARPGMVTDGPNFIDIQKGDASKLFDGRDPEKLLRAQLPEGVELDEMLGACPGAPGEVRLTYFPKLQRKAMKTTDWRATESKNDFATQWRLEDLKPGTEYAAVIEARPVGGDELTAVIRGAFQTAPKASATEKVKFCVTTCHDFYRRDDGLAGHRIYPAMTEIDPDFVVHAGDIEYYDKPQPWAVTIPLMRFKWGRLFSLPSNRAFYQQTSSYFIKDDHDTLKNDCWAGQMFGAVSFEEGVRLFNEEQFPTHTPRYKTVQWGRDLQVWFLEGRDYRSPNNMADGPDKTILGQTQKAWLFETMAQSDAKFKLIFSPTPIVGPDRANKKDNHANTVFAYEGEQIRQEFTKHDGVIVFCGDRHWQYASVDDQTGLWEFGCGPGSEKHQLGWKKGDERPVHRFLRVAGGFLSGQLSYKGGEPSLTVRHHKVTGEQVSEFKFPLSE